MTNISDEETAIIRTERGLTIAGTRITIYDIMDHVTAHVVVVPLRLTDEILPGPCGRSEYSTVPSGRCIL